MKKKIKASIASFLCLILPIPVIIIFIKTFEIFLAIVGVIVVGVLFWCFYELWYDHFDYLDNK
jgi:Na+/melibiose symporter-like transporter